MVPARLLETGVAGADDFVVKKPATDEDILLVHTPAYIQKLKTGALSRQEELLLKLPSSEQVVQPF